LSQVTRSRIVALLVLAAALGAWPAAHALGAREAAPSAAAAKREAAKKLYRKYCGQCHALREARAAGSGSGKGLGEDGGPNFNNLRVPFMLSVQLLTQRSAGHERIAHKLTWKQVKQVAEFVADATKQHAVVAHATDG
jgi:mono/diheme cytochrome c family protein